MKVLCQEVKPPSLTPAQFQTRVYRRAHIHITYTVPVALARGIASTKLEIGWIKRDSE